MKTALNRLARSLVILSCVITPALAQTRLFNLVPQNLPHGSYDKSPIWLGDVNGDDCDDFALVGGGTSFKTVTTVFSGTDGQELFSFDAAGAGRAILGGDIDGDGIPEILSATLNSVRVNSGRTGEQLMTIPALARSWTFATALANAGDVDKDGVPDLLVGDWDGAVIHMAGRVWVFSGANGKMILSVVGTMRHERLGFRVAPAGDVNQDGYADIATNGGVGQVLVFSGRDGKRLRTYSSGVPLQLEGADMDGDKVLDLVVRTGGAVRVYSGVTGSERLIAEFKEGAHSMGLLPDLDGDGIRDVAVGHAVAHTAGGRFAGRVDVIDSRTRTVRYSIEGLAPNAGRGGYLAGGGDANGDGVDDLLIGNLGFLANNWNYRFEVRSLTQLSLAADVHEVSIPARSIQTMSLDAGRALAGRPYLLIGSVLGTHPGIKYQGFTIPLNPGGPYLPASLVGGVPMLSNAAGILDAAGRGTVRFRMPVGWPVSMAGITVHHAYVVFDGAFNLLMVSPAVPVTPTR